MKKRGQGIACMWYGIGKTGLPNPSRVELSLRNGGRILLSVGAADIGQGSNTILRQIAAEELRVPLVWIEIISADTDLTLDSGVTSASRQAFVTGKAVMLGAQNLLSAARRELAVLHHSNVEEVSYLDGVFFLRDDNYTWAHLSNLLAQNGKSLRIEAEYDPPTTPLDNQTGAGAPYATYAFATQMAEVEVDTLTGYVQVLRLTAIHDVGRTLNKTMAEGQIEGGCSMGVGYALTEEYSTAAIKRGFADYIMPTCADMPDMNIILVEDPEPEGPFGAKGLGEPPVVATAAAIANAIYNAIGIQIDSLPVSPEKIVAALHVREGE